MSNMNENEEKIFEVVCDSEQDAAIEAIESELKTAVDEIFEEEKDELVSEKTVSLEEVKGTKAKKTMKKPVKILLRALAVLGVTLLLLVGGIYGVCYVLIHGPSEMAKNQFVFSVKESSAMGWVAHLYLSNAEIEEILSNRGIVQVPEGTVSDPGKIEIPKPEDNVNDEQPDIELIDIKGTTYRGKLLIVKDPSRVFVGTVDKFYEGTGKVVSAMAEKYGAVAGINGGEFFDAGSYAYSALPVGGVISQGKHVYGNLNTKYNLSGFTNDNKFVIGNMTIKEALAMGMRDAVHTKHTTGPFLVLNGEALTVPGVDVYGGGKNPRTAIGQRADGSVLLLVVDGRQANSIGATFEELAYIMLNYGAVNASAMDGGTSTQMYFNGEVVNSPYSPTGPRTCPTCFLVAPLATEE